MEHKGKILRKNLGNGIKLDTFFTPICKRIGDFNYLRLILEIDVLGVQVEQKVNIKENLKL
jgi:hypothetical protein